MGLGLENKKIELIQWLTTLDDVSLIDKLLEIRKNESADWWQEISEEERTSIEKGIGDAEDGKLTEHLSVKENYERWL